jgi:N-methylhydantoinase B
MSRKTISMRKSAPRRSSSSKAMRQPDPTRLEIFKNIAHSIAEEMGAALRRSAFSPNIKERRDYSCAVYDAAGEVLAMGDHMPVHLGSMPASVSAVRSALLLESGDIAVLNDPFAGGTHLPDLTMVMPVHLQNNKQPFFYVANRAHHADIGGSLAGSMGPAREIFEEGLRIPAVHIVRCGQVNRDVLSMILANVRTPAEREGDLAAQIASCRTGELRLREIANKYGERELHTCGDFLLEYSEKMMTSALRALKPGVYTAEDFLDGDGVAVGEHNEPLKIRVRIKITRDHAEVDFSGSAPQCAGNVNAVEAIAVSAVYYVFRCLLAEDVPATSGLIRPIRVIAPAGTIVNAMPPAAVAGGNVETSQRMVDTLFRALAKAAPSRIPAASQGTMNNLTLGGRDPRNNNSPFAYYETIAGGMGARPGLDGISAVHTHMTNSWNTPIEVFEQTYPVRVRSYSIRRNSGGAGKFRGGGGIIREIELLTPMQVGILSDRRDRGPYGLAGGAAGKRGKNELIRDKKKILLPGKCAFHAEAGSILRIETPGGGGWGRKKKTSRETRKKSSGQRRRKSLAEK